MIQSRFLLSSTYLSLDISESMERWKSLRTRTRYRDKEKLETGQAHHLLPWNWFSLACRSENYQQLCEVCSPQQPVVQRCRHRKIDRPQSGYTNPME
jgi:hypothetical protein